MAAPLPKEERSKIVEYLDKQDLSDLTGFQIKELVKDNLGINISQPTASKLKGEILMDSLEDDASSLESHPVLSEAFEATKPAKPRHLSQDQTNALDRLLQGQSDRSVAEALGVSRQVVRDWRNSDPLFIAELNRRRHDLWDEAQDRMKSLTSRALDVLEQQLESDDPKVSLAAAKYVLQSNRLLGDTPLSIKGPTTPEEVILKDLRREARQEWEAKNSGQNQSLDFLFDHDVQLETHRREAEIEALAKSKLKKALAEAGL